MITIEKLSLFNIENFRKLYNAKYRSYICDRDFFTIYDEESFVVKYLLRKQVKIFKYNNKHIGYIWYDESKIDNTLKNIYSMYFFDDFIELLDDKVLDFIKCNTLKLDIVENESISNLMNRLGFTIYSKTCLMKLIDSKKPIEVKDGINFKHFIKNCDEKLRCDVQN